MAQAACPGAASVGKVSSDLAFKEKSVKDITDRGRAEGASRLQQALEEALQSLPPLPQPLPASVQEDVDSLEEAELRRDVRDLVRPLASLREVGNSVARNTAVMEILLQLRKLQLTVSCLKATKVAAELNQPCWRGDKVSAEVRELAASLVRKWRAIYRSQVVAPATLSASAVRRRCRNVAMDLEECTHGHFPRSVHYVQLVEAVCRFLLHDAERTRKLFSGTLATSDIVSKLAEVLRRKQGKKQRQ